MPKLTPLGEIIKTHILKHGSIRQADYMDICLNHTQFGYYQQQQPFGSSGDFVTSPELTPLFGEMLGVWVVDVITKLNCTRIALVEIGGGNGTLISDITRIVQRLLPEHIDVEIHMVETSARLQNVQKNALKTCNFTQKWYENLDNLPQIPCIFIANELFDALPCQLYKKKNSEFFERVIITNERNRFAFEYKPCKTPEFYAPEFLSNMRNNETIENCAAAQSIISKITHHIQTHNGAALMIDYGYVGPKNGDSLQALKSHDYVNPLENQGFYDLTTHVDFAALQKNASHLNSYLTTQGEFLKNMGILMRLERILPTLSSENQYIISSTVNRLISPQQMGDLFKVLAISSLNIAVEGFYTHA